MRSLARLRRFVAHGIEGFVRSQPNVATGVVLGTIVTGFFVIGICLAFL